MKTTKEFWSRKQFTDSSTIEQWITSKQQQQQQQQQQQNNNNHRDDGESASVGGRIFYLQITDLTVFLQ